VTLALDRLLAGRITDVADRNRMMSLAEQLRDQLEEISRRQVDDAPDVMWLDTSTSDALVDESTLSRRRARFPEFSLAEFEQRPQGYAHLRNKTLRPDPAIEQTAEEQLQARLESEQRRVSALRRLATDLENFALCVDLLLDPDDKALRNAATDKIRKDLLVVEGEVLRGGHAEEFPQEFRAAWEVLTTIFDFNVDSTLSDWRTRLQRNRYQVVGDPKFTLDEILSGVYLEDLCMLLRHRATALQTEVTLQQRVLELPAEERFIGELSASTRRTIVESPFFAEVVELLGERFCDENSERFDDIVSACDPRTPGWRLPGVTAKDLSRGSELSIVDR
jgi:hypothetical protein